MNSLVNNIRLDNSHSVVNREMLRLTRNFYPLPAFSYGARSSENAGECLSSMAPVERNSEKVSIASEDENRDEVVFSGSSIAALERQRQEQLKDLLFEVEPSARLSHQAETACITN